MFKKRLEILSSKDSLSFSNPFFSLFVGFYDQFFHLFTPSVVGDLSYLFEFSQEMYTALCVFEDVLLVVVDFVVVMYDNRVFRERR